MSERGSWQRNIQHGHRKIWALVPKDGLRGQPIKCFTGV